MEESPILDKAISRVHLGRSVLFLGAGFSRESINACGKKLPVGAELAQIISSKMGLDDDDLADVSELYQKEHGVSSLIEILKGEFLTAAATPSQVEIIQNPWSIIYTTNYDNVIEKSVELEDIKINVLSRSNNPSDIKKDILNIVHLNGLLQTVNQVNFQSEILLTSYQYLTNELRNSSWSPRFRADIMTADSVFFVGYSLYDFDIAKILLDPVISGKRLIFIQHDSVRPAQLSKLQRFGEVVQCGIDDFAARLKAQRAISSDTESPGFLVNVREFELPPSPSTVPSDESVFSLLFKGDVQHSGLLWDAVNNVDSYAVSRNSMEQAIAAAQKPGSFIFVHGDIGNGKRLFTEDFIVRARLSGIERCFIYEPISDSLSDDIAVLSKISERILIVVRDLYSNFEAASTFRQMCPTAVIMTTSRSAIYQIRNLPIDTGPPDNFFEIDLKIVRLDTYLGKFGFWGRHAGRDSQWRIDFIKAKCNRAFRTLLLDLFDQQVVSDQLGRVVSEARNEDKTGFAHLVQLLALSAADLDLPFKSVAEIFGVDFANSFVQQRSGWQREFFHKASGRQSVKSTLLAIFLLNKFVSDRDLIDEISELCYKVDQLSQGNPIYRRKVALILRFGFIERLFQEDGKREKLIRFYEAVRQYGVGGRNPQFWLQYAIARMSFRDYEAAGTYFDTAFALASGFRDYDDYMISTHYARYLLESRTNSNKFQDASENFFKLHELIMKQTGKTTAGHYPYRIASGYLAYLEAKGEDFSPDDVARARGCCNELLERIESLNPDLKKNRYVEKSQKSLSQAIEFLAALTE
jgi:SIR2-like domain